MLRKKSQKKPARIHSPDPFLRAGNAVSVLPNPYPQKIVWQNRVHRMGTRIPSVSPLGETRPHIRHPFQNSKKIRAKQKSIGVAGAGGGYDGAVTEASRVPFGTSARWSGRYGVTEFFSEREIGFTLHTAWSVHITCRCCHCRHCHFENRFGFGKINAQQTN